MLLLVAANEITTDAWTQEENTTM